MNGNALNLILERNYRTNRNFKEKNSMASYFLIDNLKNYKQNPLFSPILLI